jgi:hypothetical protein
MEPKDVLTLTISIAAFALSAVATVLTLQRKRVEEERSQRALLSEAIGKIVASRTEHAKFYTEHPNADENTAMSAVLGMYNYQINAFARLAVYMTEKIPQLVSDIEFSIIADAFGWTGDQAQALKFWEITIRQSKDNYYAILNRRTFATYLFRIGNVGGGRDQYKTALTLSPVADDNSKYMTGYTYGMWGYDELSLGNRKSAADLFASADEAFSTMSAEQSKKYGLQKLEAGKQALRKPDADLTPGAAVMNPSLRIIEPTRDAAPGKYS